ncbi:MAG TPA: VOC family protein [Thermoleophilaceae bacterium]|nr:VOC family protein [Thermoleophilaceae bacterium]
MGKRASYAPGTFSFVDLATTDAGSAKAFYAGLFGWEMEDTEAGGGAVYTLCRLDGDVVCGLFEMPDDMRATGLPANWTSYVTVDSADAVTTRAQGLGGRAIDEAFEVLDVGRMAVLADPQGAVFAVWQPRSRIGAERVNDIGCLCMNELATTDIEAARTFYEGLFGWKVVAVGAAPADGPVAMALNGGALGASFFTAAPGVPAHWRPCFTVESTESALERVRGLGGAQLHEPVELEDGIIVMVRDPQGALLTLYAGEVDP